MSFKSIFRGHKSCWQRNRWQYVICLAKHLQICFMACIAIIVQSKWLMRWGLYLSVVPLLAKPHCKGKHIPQVFSSIWSRHPIFGILKAISPTNVKLMIFCVANPWKQVLQHRLETTWCTWCGSHNVLLCSFFLNLLCS